MLRSVAAVVLVGFGVVKAQSISSQCQSALLTIAGSPDAQCLNPTGLIPLLTTSSNTSLVTPFTNWLQGACAQDACTNSSLSAIVTNITNGCGNDLAGLGFSNDSVPEVIAGIQEAYPIVRSIACLKDTTNNTLCATTLLDELQQATGSLSLNNITSLPQIVMGSSLGLPSYITCSDCVKEAYNVLKQQVPEVASSTEVSNAFQSQCGASFVDGTSPSQIAEGTGTAAPSSNTAANGAFSFSHAMVGTTVASLSVVFGALVVLV